MNCTKAIIFRNRSLVQKSIRFTKKASSAFARQANASKVSAVSPDRPRKNEAKMKLYFADWAKVDLPRNHRFPMEKYELVRERLRASEIEENLSVRFVESPLASVEDVLLTHDEAYVKRVIEQKLSREEARTIGFPMNGGNDNDDNEELTDEELARGKQHVTRSLASTGGTIAATRNVLENDSFMWAGQLAGGTHHAFRDHGEGFCVFNDIACAINVARRDYKHLFVSENTIEVKKILIVDLDVHQGNGTAKIFEDDTDVITYSMHGDRNYPWKTRTISDYDIALPDNCEDDEYLEKLNASLPAVFEKHKPFLVYFQAGIDALKEDSFGRLSLTREGLRKRNNIMFNLCIKYKTKLVVTMGGGYAKPIEPSIECHADVFRIMALKNKGIVDEQNYLLSAATSNG